MRLIPLEGRSDIPFGASADDVIRTLGDPDADQTVHDIDSHPKGRRTLRYGHFSVTISSELGVYGMGVRVSSEPIVLWDTHINDLSADEFAALLLSHGGRSKTSPLTSYGATDVYSAEYGILAYFASDTLNQIEIQIPYSCPTEY